MPITRAILLEVSAMLSSSVGRDQVSQVSTGTPGGGCEDRYDFGMMSAKRLRNENQHFFSSTNPREKIGKQKNVLPFVGSKYILVDTKVSGAKSLAEYIQTFHGDSLGGYALGHHLMMDLNDDEAINGSLRI